MPRFYFDVFDGNRAVIDGYGDVFVDAQDAAGQAGELLTTFARESLPNGRSQDFGVAVRNDGGRDVYRAALVFRDVHLDAERTEGPHDAGLPLAVPNPVELIREARAIRAEARAISDQVKGVRADLRETLRQIADTMRLAGAMPVAIG